MSGWQLVAHPESDVCGVAILSMLRAFKSENAIARPDTASNIEEARETLRRNDPSLLELVVIASTMPSDGTASMGMSSREPTKEFVSQLKACYPGLPIVVLASTPDESLADFLGEYDRTGLVTVDSDFSASLTKRISILRAKAARREDSWIQLDIHIGGNQRGGWQISRIGVDEFRAQGTLQVDRALLGKFIRNSKRLDETVAKNDEEWFEELKDLSSDLRELLFRTGRDNMDFWDRFLKHRERVGGVARSRVRLTVDEDTHSMLFEALRDSEGDDDEFWVLNAPVFRRYEQQLALPPLFKERASRDKPINCMVIEADPAAGVVVGRNGGVEELSQLEHVSREAAAVETILKQHAGGAVERLSLSDVDDVHAAVIGKLRERQWHVVHFCGHVAGDAEHASFVLRANPRGVMPVKAFAALLTRTQLLFLSSCRSASTRIVMHAVERHVSAVVGFQWVIGDRAAADFAQDFYTQLFDSTQSHVRDLEFALLEARRKAHQRQPGDPSWVAPVLVMQMG
jgi:hypothetical protein